MSPHTTTTALKKRPLKRFKQFRCEGYGECGMVFSRSEHLLRHIRKHTGERPYKCAHPKCNKTFSRYDNMRQHHVTHLKAKPKPANNNNSENENENDLYNEFDLDNKNENEKDIDNIDDGALAEILTDGIKGEENAGVLEHLTQDELDALDALNQFRHPSHATYKTSTTSSTKPTS